MNTLPTSSALSSATTTLHTYAVPYVRHELHDLSDAPATYVFRIRATDGDAARELALQRCEGSIRIVSVGRAELVKTLPARERFNKAYRFCPGVWDGNCPDDAGKGGYLSVYINQIVGAAEYLKKKGIIVVGTMFGAAAPNGCPSVRFNIRLGDACRTDELKSAHYDPARPSRRAAGRRRRAALEAAGAVSA